MTDTTPPGVVTQSQVYEQRCAEFRSLNGFFWQIPLIVMTLNGGLWFGVSSLDLTTLAREMILVFAAGANGAMIVVLWRLRGLMETLLSQIRAAEGITDPRAAGSSYGYSALSSAWRGWVPSALQGFKARCSSRKKESPLSASCAQVDLPD